MPADTLVASLVPQHHFFDGNLAAPPTEDQLRRLLRNLVDLLDFDTVPPVVTQYLEDFWGATLCAANIHIAVHGSKRQVWIDVFLLEGEVPVDLIKQALIHSLGGVWEHANLVRSCTAK